MTCHFVTAAVLFAISLQAATTDLLQPAWQQTWQVSTEKEVPVKVAIAPETGWITASRPAAIFNPIILSTSFGSKGPLPVGATTPAEVTLEKVGDTIGVRVVFTYNSKAINGLKANLLRLGLANSAGTRQSTPLSAIANEIFADDVGWSINFGQGEFNTILLSRTTDSHKTLKNNILTSTAGAKNIRSWPSPLLLELIKPGEPAEAIFSLTKTGPEEISVYGFLASREFEHTVKNVTNFTFDTVIFHYPNSGAQPGASFTIREFQLMTP